MNTTKNTQAIANTQGYFTTEEVAKMLGLSTKGLLGYVYFHKGEDFVPKKATCKGHKGKKFLWTQEEINRLIEYRKTRHFKADIDHAETTIAIPETNKTTTVSTNTATPETLIAMFDAFLEIEQEEQKSENRAANRKFRYLFENMTEKDMQDFFKPLTERFKFSYITKVIDDIQSQTLTCIKNGKLHWCEDTNEYRCEDCCTYCNYHEEWESYRSGNMYYIENYGYICEEAYNNGDFYYCDHCGNYFYRDRDTSYDVKNGRYDEVWCEDCVDRDAVQCDKCGAIYDNDNRDIAFYDHKGHTYCEECAEDMDILVTCEYCGCVDAVEWFEEVDGMYFCGDYCHKQYMEEHEEELVTANCECE